jgi:hypothetical protein
MRAAPLLLAAVRSPEMGRVRATAVRGRWSRPKTKGKAWGTRWWGFDYEAEVREGRTAKERLQAGRGNSGEGFRSRGGGFEVC